MHKTEVLKGRRPNTPTHKGGRRAAQHGSSQEKALWGKQMPKLAQHPAHRKTGLNTLHLVTPNVTPFDRFLHEETGGRTDFCLLASSVLHLM